MAGPLYGIRVVDFSAMIAGPYCARLLADLGAQVIKVEPPEGDPMRGRPPLKDGESLYFGALNLGKQSVSLDLKSARGTALARNLIAKADVLLENFRPGVMARLKLDYATLSASNPRLVYCSISGYGQQGAHSGLPAYAPIVQAMSGYDLANLGYQKGAGKPPQGVADKPLNTGIFTADYLAGTHAFGAISAALLQRANTGAGTQIDCALMDAMLGMLVYEVGDAQSPVGRERLLYEATRAKDGFFIVAPISQANFAALATATGNPGWMQDPRYATRAVRSDARNWNAMLAELDAWAANRTVAECEARMTECGVPFGRYQGVREAMDSPYAEERGLFATAAAGATTFRTALPPFRMAGIAAGARVPERGEHGAQVLGELLGLSPEDIEQLRAERVLH